uniref:NADH dehydrogenase subunit 2 n=1 Tax=Melecta chinensis TaxID=582934 RepID=UPI002551F236|nr:NADH dehydrogenase subunit 2 [Melecta chinensis]WFP44650.1 NADH dehydrogenase subunit 2 [Melecta chinensis]
MKGNWMMWSMFFWIMMIFMIMTNNIILKWFMAETCTIVMIFILAKHDNPVASTFYYMISGASMITFLLMMLMKCGMIGLSNPFEILFQILMFMKLAIYPFSTWLICSVEFMAWHQIFFMSTFMKVIPIILFKEMEFSVELIYYLVLANLALSVESIKYVSMKKIFACSSISQNFVFLVLAYCDKSLFLWYFLVYTILTFWIMKVLEDNYIYSKSDLNKLSESQSLIYTILIITYSFLPPMMMFMLKWTLMFNTLFDYSDYLWMIMYLYTLSNVVMIWNYFNLMKTPDLTGKKSTPKPLKYKMYLLPLIASIAFMAVSGIYMSMY